MDELNWKVASSVKYRPIQSWALSVSAAVKESRIQWRVGWVMDSYGPVCSMTMGGVVAVAVAVVVVEVSVGVESAMVDCGKSEMDCGLLNSEEAL